MLPKLAGITFLSWLFRCLPGQCTHESWFESLADTDDVSHRDGLGAVELANEVPPSVSKELFKFRFGNTSSIEFSADFDCQPVLSSGRTELVVVGAPRCLPPGVSQRWIPEPAVRQTRCRYELRPLITAHEPNVGTTRLSLVVTTKLSCTKVSCHPRNQLLETSAQERVGRRVRESRKWSSAPVGIGLA